MNKVISLRVDEIETIIRKSYRIGALHGLDQENFHIAPLVVDALIDYTSNRNIKVEGAQMTEMFIDEEKVI